MKALGCLFWAALFALLSFATCGLARETFEWVRPSIPISITIQRSCP